ncbi:MAG: hypothetical protein QM723_34555 [Myxococcaceae bacterium]
MKRLLFVLPVLFALACTKESGSSTAAPAEEKSAIKEVDVDTAAGLLDSKSAKAVDANTEEFRAQNGVVPGAVLLTNYLDWEPPEVLGPDKNQQVIFYCSSRT